MKKILTIMLIAILGFSFQSFSQGDLLITPKRVVFEGNKQKEELSLVNIGKDTAVYSISFLQYNMREDGSLVVADKSDSTQKFADGFLRVFPRKVTLAPGEPQVIVLQCRRKPDMRPGEYRSHLYFRSEKNYKPLGIGNSAKDTTLLSVQLIPVYGMSIPIIIRSGSVNVSCSLSNLKLETMKDDIQNLKLTINRTGNISVYGDIIIEYLPAQGKSFEIGASKGLGIYTNINSRNIAVKLNSDHGKIQKNGKLRVRYQSNDDTKKPVVYTTEELEFNQ